MAIAESGATRTTIRRAANVAGAVDGPGFMEAIVDVQKPDQSLILLSFHSFERPWLTKAIAKKNLFASNSFMKSSQWGEHRFIVV